MTLQKLNLGCGSKRISGFLNVDKYGEPDFRWDLEQFPWPWETSSVSEVRLVHVLEHLGQNTDVFIMIIKELYRICEHDARIEITVPHPRHDDFLNDPTHVRPITAETFALFSKANNRQWAQIGAANSQLGISHDVDFEIIDGTFNLDPRWLKRIREESISNDQIMEISLSQNNVIQEIKMTIRVVK